MRGGIKTGNPQRFKVQVRLFRGIPLGKVVRKKATFKRPKDLDAWRVGARKPTTLQGTSTLEGCSDLALIYLRTGMFINIK
jgi:hypothetical protein